MITEIMLSQVDSEGRHFKSIKKICDHRPYWSAIPEWSRFNVSKNGKNTPKSTTVGWNMQVEWKYVSMQWL